MKLVMHVNGREYVWSVAACSWCDSWKCKGWSTIWLDGEPQCELEVHATSAQIRAAIENHPGVQFLEIDVECYEIGDKS